MNEAYEKTDPKQSTELVEVDHTITVQDGRIDSSDLPYWHLLGRFFESSLERDEEVRIKTGIDIEKKLTKTIRDIRDKLGQATK